jgi:transposase
MSKAYSSNLTQAQWQLLEPLILPAKPGGRPRKSMSITARFLPTDVLGDRPCLDF